MPGLFSSESRHYNCAEIMAQLLDQHSSEVVGAAELWVGEMSGTSAAGLLPEQRAVTGGGHLIICR